jgi:hypothetical protein
MLIAAAVCPHPPLLIPAATGSSGTGHEELDRLRMACRQAVAGLLAARPDLVVAVGGARHTAEYPPDAPGRLHDFGVPFSVGAADPDVPALPLSLTVGKWLLSEHRVPRTVWWGIASDTRPAECLQLGEKLAALAPRVALLALGDGAARRAQAAPGAADPAADRYDEQVAAALAAADPGALAALDPRQDGPLVVAGRAAWQVLAGAAAGSTAGERFAAELRYAGAPFEVSYLVASWRRAH